jgi:hypothetical protein
MSKLIQFAISWERYVSPMRRDHADQAPTGAEDRCRLHRVDACVMPNPASLASHKDLAPRDGRDDDATAFLERQAAGAIAAVPNHRKEIQKGCAEAAARDDPQRVRRRGAPLHYHLGRLVPAVRARAHQLTIAAAVLLLTVLVLAAVAYLAGTLR